eukprot:6206996-Pleurochrysis_carterae.AAC.2
MVTVGERITAADCAWGCVVAQAEEDAAVAQRARVLEQEEERGRAAAERLMRSEAYTTSQARQADVSASGLNCGMPCCWE